MRQRQTQTRRTRRGLSLAALGAAALLLTGCASVSYTHLTLPTNREV